MPELPEVEVVRRGLQAHVAGKTITAVRVHHPRAVRRHEAGPADLTARLLDSRITGTGRRGKYLWLTLDDESALVVHLGMSGQMLLGPLPTRGPPAHRGAARRRHHAELRRPAHVRRLDARRHGHRRRHRCPGAGRAHRPRPAGPAVQPRRCRYGVAAQAFRDQAPAARPDRGVGHRQHLRRRGAVAGQGQRRPARVVADPQASSASCSTPPPR